MSKIKYDKEGKVLERKGEYFAVSSCYTTPKSVHVSEMYNDPLFAALEGDVDELTNKPRRFFDHLLSIMEYKRDNDPMINKGNHRAYYDEIIRGCELWSSAIDNGLYGEVLRLAEPTTKKGEDLIKEYDL
jgi:hypothetical protein